MDPVIREGTPKQLMPYMFSDAAQVNTTSPTAGERQKVGARPTEVMNLTGDLSKVKLDSQRALSSG